ncbi:ATP-binding protein [Streptomyces xanthophaeus]|uniref:ATP-binding protein n=1 Tax=Streptomyces xanthophaeus TaxID=67385 RepID=UPI00343469E1
MTTATREPQRAGTLAARLQAILAAKGIDPDTAPAGPTVEPVTTLELADRRIPPRYREALANQPEVLGWVEAVTGAGRNGPAGTRGIAYGPSLLIAGPTGIGKTHQAYGAVRSLLAAGVRLRWQAVTSADLYAQLRPRPNHDPEREIQELGRCPLLILDDLGAAKQSEWTEELTYRLINRRYTEMLPTLITTNLPIAELRNAVGDRVASRLAEMTTRVILTGPDRRRAQPSGS